MAQAFVVGRLTRRSGSNIINHIQQRNYRKEYTPSVYNKRVKVKRNDSPSQYGPFPFAVTEQNRLEVLLRLVSPLHDTPYEEQLQSKESFCKNALRYFAQQLYKQGTPVRVDVKRLPCKVDPIIRAPKLHNYRNKDDFSIWEGVNGKPTVGFFAFPLSKHGDTICLEPNGCTTIKDEATLMVDVLQGFLRDHSKIGFSRDFANEGGWKRFVIKSNTSGELMVLGIASPVNLKVSEVVEERENFKNYIKEKSMEAGLELKSLYFQPCPRGYCPHSEVPYELLFGDKTITETICDKMFVLSPESTMHNNSTGVELLYEAIRNTIHESLQIMPTDGKPLVMDLGCGSGLLSMNLADIAKQVIGIDTSSLCIEDSIQNAKLNGIENFTGLCGLPELMIEQALQKYSRSRLETIVVCNPTKSIGLHEHIMKTIRNCPTVRRMIYITRNADREPVIDNWMTLCEKGIGRSAPPFMPVRATPVDLYPQMPYCELIVAFERVSQ